MGFIAVFFIIGITNKVMQNPIQKFKQSSTVFERPGFLSEKLKTPGTRGFNNFYWNFAHIFDLTIPTKHCPGFFLFCIGLELFAKIKKRSGF